MLRSRAPGPFTGGQVPVICADFSSQESALNKVQENRGIQIALRQFS
jgi:hypothetical protein